MSSMFMVASGACNTEGKEGNTLGVLIHDPHTSPQGPLSLGHFCFRIHSSSSVQLRTLTHAIATCKIPRGYMPVIVKTRDASLVPFWAQGKAAQEGSSRRRTLTKTRHKTDGGGGVRWCVGRRRLNDCSRANIHSNNHLSANIFSV